MSKFKVTYRTLFFQLLPFFLRTALHLRYLFSAAKPLQTLNDDGVIVRDFDTVNPSFFQLFRFLDEFVKFDARTIYLQKWLNLYYDPLLERVKIVNNNNLPFLHLFNKVEEKPPVYFYNEWDSTVAYVASPEDYVHDRGVVYVCTANNTGNRPPNTNFWTKEKDINFMFNDGDTQLPDYTVEVPIAVELQPDYSTDRITRHVNQFNAAGTTFQIRVV